MALAMGLEVFLRISELFNLFEAHFLYHLLLTLLLHKEFCPIVAIAGLQSAYAEQGTVFVLSPVFDLEILDLVVGEEILQDHFCLTFAVIVAFSGKGYIHPAIEIP